MKVDLKLAGKHALVTGSSSRIGEAIAKELACEGAAHDRNQAEIARVKEEILPQMMWLKRLQLKQ